MRDPTPTKLELKQIDQAKLSRGRHIARKWETTPECAREREVIAEFRALWQQQLAEIQAQEAEARASF